MASNEQVIEFLGAGLVECPVCSCEVQTVARVVNRDSGGMPTVDQFRFGACGACGTQIEARLAPNGLE